MKFDTTAFVPAADLALLSEQEVQTALADPQMNPVAQEVHRLTRSYAERWLSLYVVGAGEDLTVEVALPLSAIERVALELMAQMAVDAVGAPLAITYVDPPGASKV